MARYADAYRRSGRQALEDVRNVFANLQKQNAQKEFYNTFLNAYKDWQNRQADVSKDIELIGNVVNPFESKIMDLMPNDPLIGTTRDNQKRASHNSSLAGFGATVQPAQVKNPFGITIPETPQAPEAQTRNIPPQERYQKAQESSNQFFNEIIPLILNGNVGNEELSRVDAISRYIENQTSGLKPNEEKPTEWKYIEGKDGIYAFNPLNGKTKKVTDFPQEQRNIFGTPSDRGYWTDKNNDGQLEFNVNPYYKELTGRTGKGDTGTLPTGQNLGNIDESDLMITAELQELDKGMQQFQNMLGAKPKAFGDLPEADQDYYLSQINQTGERDVWGMADLRPEELSVYNVDGELIPAGEFSKNKLERLRNTKTIQPYAKRAKDVAKKYEKGTGIEITKALDIIKEDMARNKVSREEAIKRLLSNNPDLPETAKKIIQYNVLFNE